VSRSSVILTSADLRELVLGLGSEAGLADPPTLRAILSSGDVIDAPLAK